MNTLIDWIKWLVGLAQPENLQALANMSGHAWVSYLILSAIIFSETGLLVGFFLPGDSLLFAAGLLSSQNVFDARLLIVTLSVAAVVGDAVNYYAGLQMGEHVFERGRLLARFVPLVRTFTPFVAGVARMGYARFVIYNLIGGIGWITSMTLSGYWLGQIAWIRDHFEFVVMTIIFISVLPVVGGVAKHWLSPAKPVSGDEVVAVAEAGEGRKS
jgi:membrane-associated protein